MTCTTEQAAQFDHAPGADLDYGFNWRENGWLETDETITSSIWSVQPDSIALSRHQILQESITSVFVGGGVIGRQYRLTNTIVTSQGRADNRTILLTCNTR